MRIVIFKYLKIKIKNPLRENMMFKNKGLEIQEKDEICKLK